MRPGPSTTQVTSIPQQLNANGDVNTGRQIVIDSEELLKHINFRMLSATELPKRRRFLIPRKIRMDMLQIKLIFTKLVEANPHINENIQPGNDDSHETRKMLVFDESHEKVPTEAFQRAFERLFFMLEDPEGFNAKDYDKDSDGAVTWSEFFDVYKSRNITINLSIFERVFQTMENPESSYLAQCWSIFMLGIIMLSSFSFILGTLPGCQHQDPPLSKPTPVPAFEVVETTCLVIFCIEYLLRVCTVWAVRTDIFDEKRVQELVTGYNPIRKQSPFWKLIKFVIMPSNVIDLAAILPAVLSALLDAEGGGFVILRLIRLTRIFRAFKSPALAEPVFVIGQTITQSTKALYVLVFNLLLGIVIFGSLMFLAEGQGKWDEESHTYHRIVGSTWNKNESRWEDEWDVSPFPSIPHTFWWAMVTAATVGYGDHYPTTILGKLVAVMTMVFSLVILALPVGVMGGTFSQVWQEFKVQRHEMAKKLEEEKLKVTGAIQRLDPIRMSNLLLIEVWNDENGQGHMDLPHSSNFLGEVTVEMQLDPHKSFSSDPMTLSLASNVDIVKRRCTGSVTIKYEWTPSSAVAPRTDETSQQLLHSNTTECPVGKLTVSLLHANNLVNVCSTRQDQYSSPYCIMLVYPIAPKEDNKLVPTVWRTPTVLSNVKPKWEKDFSKDEYTHEFNFKWVMTEKRRQGSSRNMDLSSSGGSTRSKKSHEGKGNYSGPLTVTKLDDVMSMLACLDNELGNVRDDVVTLHGRIDSYLQDGASAPMFSPPSLPNIQPTALNEEEQPEQAPVFLPGSVLPES